MRNHPALLVGAIIAGVLALIFTSASFGAVVVATIAGYAIFRIGFAMLGGMARPIPEPPPPGELRKVRLTYRCPICGTEVRMTSANDQVPEPPRHCMDEMDLVTPVDDL